MLSIKTYGFCYYIYNNKYAYFVTNMTLILHDSPVLGFKMEIDKCIVKTNQACWVGMDGLMRQKVNQLETKTYRSLLVRQEGVVASCSYEALDIWCSLFNAYKITPPLSL
jgi:hypothetical protein